VNTHPTKDNIKKSSMDIILHTINHIKIFPVNHRPDDWLGSVVNHFF
jgi:hypothetical protein